MELNISFDKDLEKIISLYNPLKEWFINNQNELVYYEFTNPTLLDIKRHYELNDDALVLRKMAKAIFQILYNDKINDNLEKAKKMAIMIEYIYNSKKDILSEISLNKYYIDNKQLEGKYTLKFKKKKTY